MAETDRSGRRPDIAARLGARTLALSNINSVSRDEDAIVASIHEELRVHDSLEILDHDDSVVFAGPRVRRVDAPFVVLAGHVDTVPMAGARMPAERVGESIVGRGTSDMKAGLAVMLEIAHEMALSPGARDLDVGYLFFGREELPINESALLPLFDRCPAASTIELAVVMEPTDNAIEVGCLGNLNADVILEGTAAHSARPWLGENAIHAAIEALAPLADLPDRDVTIDGLTFREVVSITMIEGGIASNVVPDRVSAHVNYRYAPTHAPAEAEARLRELIGHRRARVEIVGNAPPGPVNVANPLVQRLRKSGDLRLGPKQAWTPVAEFATVDVDAVNFGPGDPQYAHRDDERVEVAAIVRSYEVLRRFMGLDGSPAGSPAAGGSE